MLKHMGKLYTFILIELFLFLFSFYGVILFLMKNVDIILNLQ